MNQYESHSAVVDMWLDCGIYGRVPLARIRPKTVVASEPCSIPPCDAELVVTVDGVCVRRKVMLTSGFTRGRRIARAISITESAPF
jgi:hypothetical protein